MTNRRSGIYLALAALTVGFAAGSTVGSGKVGAFLDRISGVAVPRPVEARTAPLAPSELTTIQMFEEASQSVVYIATSRLKRIVREPEYQREVSIEEGAYKRLRREWIDRPGRISVELDDRDLSYTFDPNEIPENFEWDSGSGIVWDRSGHLLTNYHVVRGAWSLLVSLPDLSEWTATVVGIDEDKDLAVLRIEAPPERLYPITIGTSDDLRVGQRAWSIGNPFGLSSTLTEGIISAVGRTIRSGTGAGRIIQDVIQTDAAINPGNSGGPLLDSSGRLVGITTAMVTESGSSSGIGFAVPVDTVNRIVPDLINHGRPTKAGLGVRVWTELKDRIDGVMIAYVLPGSAAELAGLRGDRFRDDSLSFAREGDIIVAFDGQRVAGFDDLYRLLDGRAPGDVIRLGYVRGGELLEAQIELQQLPNAEDDAPSAAQIP